MNKILKFPKVNKDWRKKKRNRINKGNKIKVCAKCKTKLTDENWYLARKKRKQYLCKDCCRDIAREYGRKYTVGSLKVFYRINKRERPDKCEICNKSSKNLKLDYHHWDDDIPELGIWVCGRCHGFVEGIECNLSVEKYMKLKIQITKEYIFKNNIIEQNKILNEN